jgi:hypothetical protein
MFGASAGGVAPILASLFSDLPMLEAGPTVGIAAGYRWGPFYLGGSYAHTFYGSATWTEKEVPLRTLSASGDTLALDIIGITAPEAAVAAMIHVSAGWRVISAQTALGGAPSWTTQSNLAVRLLGVGLWVRAGPLRIVPETALEVGPLGPSASFTVTTFFDAATATR